jgi:GNAT superfamily N-acetyltransferase
MRSLHVPMTWEEWERLPWRFGWKHEYWNGHAHLTPRQDHVHVRFDGEVWSAQLPKGLRMRPVVHEDARALINAFIEAFEDGVEFCDWPVEKIHEHARGNITDYFAGRRGTLLLKASRLALGRERQVVGAALLNGRDAEPRLDLLMVRPGFRRCGIASTLVGAAVRDLHSQGASVLRSAYCVSNRESALWHQAFGFEEEPDLDLARMRRQFLLHEMSRHEGLQAPEARLEHARLKSAFELWNRRTEELEETADREGLEAVMPALRYRWWG